MLVMTDSEHQYQRAKASLLAEERKLIQLLYDTSSTHDGISIMDIGRICEELKDIP
jgi:hypothetical protein